MVNRRDNNPKRLPPGYFNSHLGMYSQTMASYLGSYERGVGIIFESMAKHGEPIDTASHVLIYLMRHTIELGLKLTLDSLHGYLGEAKHSRGHDLVDLHRKVCIEFRRIEKTFGLEADIRRDFDKYSTAVLEVIHALDPVDFEDGQATRYPLSTKNNAIDYSQTINLLKLKNKFDDAMIFFLTADVIGSRQP